MFKWFIIITGAAALLMFIGIANSERREVHRVELGLVLNVPWVDELCEKVKHRYVELVKHNRFTCNSKKECSGFRTTYIAECENGLRYGIPVMFGGKGGGSFSYFDDYPENIGIMGSETQYTDAHAVVQLLEKRKEKKNENSKQDKKTTQP